MDTLWVSMALRTIYNYHIVKNVSQKDSMDRIRRIQTGTIVVLYHLSAFSCIALYALISVFITSCIIFEFCRHVYLSISTQDVQNVEILSSLILFITLIFTTSLMYAERRHGLQTTGVTFTFWLLLALAGAITYRSHIMAVIDKDIANIHEHDVSFVVYMMYYPFVVAELILCCFSDVSPPVKIPPGEKKLSPELNSSVLSRIAYAWFDGMILTGFRRSLQYEDVWRLNDDCSSLINANCLQKHWNEQLRKHKNYHSEPAVIDGVKIKSASSKIIKNKPSLFVALCKTFGKEFAVTVILEMINIVLLFVNPIFLDLLIKFVQSDEPAWRGYFYGIIIFIKALLQAVVVTTYFNLSYVIAVKVRAAIIAAVYRKALRLSNSSRRSSTVGEIVNLMSVDVQYFLDLIVDLNVMWSAPIQFIVAFYLLWGQLGPSVLSGIAVVILLLPANVFVMNRIELLQVKQMANKDQRVKLMNELLNGIKVLKMYAWELPFGAQINKVRLKELRTLKTTAYYNGVNDFLWRGTGSFVLLASFATYVMVDSNNILDASRAFVSVTLFNVLQDPLMLVPMVVAGIIQARVSLQRLRDFLLNEELDLTCVEHIYNAETNYPVVIEEGAFSWSSEDEVVLKDINLDVPKGKLVAIVGSVGAGKSSLLSAILGEMEKVHGRIKIQGTVAYTSQQPWIQNATLLNNIIFGSDFDAEKFDLIIKACDLTRDVENLPAGRETEIGEKGINLSGGQKQRVSLARALYKDTDIYLLDDPLSAVDSHVGKHIFENIIGPNGLLKRKTRILVTHALTYLPQVDLIVVLNNKTISEVGTYKELLDKKGAFAEYLVTFLSEAEDNEEDKALLQEIKEEILIKLGPDIERQFSRTLSKTSESSEKSHQKSRTVSTHSIYEGGEGEVRKRTQSKLELQKVADIQEGKLITTETAEIGQVNFRIYLYYLKSVGFWLGSATLIFNVLAWSSSIGTNLWLEVWSNDPLPVNGTQDTALRDLRLGVYGGLAFLFAILMLSATMMLIINCVRASYTLHEEMLTSILHSPMAFFDTTPIGRILNRFSQDLNVVDTSIPSRIRFSISCSMQLFAAVLVVSMKTPIFLVAMIPVSITYYALQKFYIMTSRQLRRMESVTRSPIYTHFSETLNGGSIIRAFKKQSEFIQESDRRVDESQSYYYANQICNRWLQIRLDALGSVIAICAITLALTSRDILNSSSVAMSITYALSLLNWCVRTMTELETNFVAVERIKEYTDTGSEASWELKQNQPPPRWPNEGCITFDDYKTRYREGLDLVLRGISCNIASGEKVGVVGRTGAGKSSLTLALLRIIEAAQGSIFIDGINISSIGLHDLRSKLTIIPQDPVLFSGTLRNNLDPFDAYSDDQVWTSLQLCHLYNFVKSLPGTLFYEIAEGGENLSVGQRQLMCLGRALLRKSKVLILDEATAAVDMETDELIQATIRKQFGSCTVITIAHRLNTIMDNDRIMVLDEGIIKEFDNPSVLLKNENSIFYKMAKDAGLV